MILNMRTMGVQELMVFREVAHAGGITAAAERLGLVKSAVSTQLNRLEERLGVTLFTRTSRRIDLTREGALLLPKVESLLAETELLFSAAESDREDVSGIVRIATTPAFGRAFADRFFRQVKSTYPDLEVILKLAYEVDDLQDPAFDFGIRIGGIGADDRLVAKRLGEFRRVLVASPEYMANNTINTPEDLHGHIQIAFSSNSTAALYRLTHLRDAAKTITLELKAQFALRSFSLIADLVSQGQGVAYLPLFIARPYLKAQRLIQPLPEWQLPPAPIYMVHRPGAQKIRRVKAAMALAKTCVREFVATDGTVDWQG